MIECPTVNKPVVQWHYDLSTVFYRLLWGPHIHHGLWSANETPVQAQVQLTDTMADLAGITAQTRMLDVGCGMGASSIHLAKRRGAIATGVTISPLQRVWASTSARVQRIQRVGGNADFVRADAEAIEFEQESFDVVWSIECTEHLFDKAAFFTKAAQWLKPGGRMAICAWLAGEQLDRQADEGSGAGNERDSWDAKQQQVLDVCEGFFCPSLGSASDYMAWMTGAGLKISRWHDWTERVASTWDICQRRVDRSGVRCLARLIDRDTVMFLDRFKVLRAAYDSGAMQYGCFVAEKVA